MLRKIAQLLLAPAATDGGGVATEFQPPKTASWINSLGALETPDPAPADAAPPATPTKKEPNGQDDPALRPDPNGPTGKSGVADDANAAKPAGDKPAAPVVADTKPADATADGKKPDDEAPTIEKMREELEKETWPRQAKDWEKKKEKYNGQLTAIQKGLETRDASIKELQGKVASYETKLSTQPAADPETATKLEQSQSLVKQLEERIAILDVTKDPRFETYFENQVKSAHEDAKAILGEEQGTAYIKLLELPEGDYKKNELSAFYQSLDDVAKTEIGAVRTKLRAIDREKAEAIKNAGDHKTKLQAEQQGKAEALKKTFENSFANQIKALSDPKTGFLAFQKRDGDAAWNAAVDARIETAKSLLTDPKISPDLVVKTALDAAALPAVLEGFKQARAKWNAEKATLEAQVKSLTAAQPAGGRGEGGEKSPPSTTATKDMNPFQRSSAWVKDMTNAMNGEG